ncbi:caspase family protein [Rhodobacter sp. Har01]|uniref:caspase family protein n=1 Tax=Rhodobacter sp. Har01 TaxID=2883999 RepID=UPI001D064E00|nr:caspase family protein [Rhodobacter sp. Har01]MCB6178577.1 caspase family protein [Rhodobacter sp. Har01]
MRFVFPLLLALASVASPCAAEGRFALVLAEADYDHLRDLKNPVSDATAMAALLEDLGFDVTLETDRDARRTRRALDDFAADAAGASLALVYYSGHGTEVQGENRLLPTDTLVDSPEALAASSLPLSEVVATLAAVAPSAILLVDACRNDPFAGTPLEDLSRGAVPLAIDGPPPAIAPGFARVGRAEGLVYAFATAPGDTASDGTGEHSPFAEALLRHLSTPGLELRTALTLATQDVYDRTRGDQTPYFESGLPDLIFTAGQPGALSERDALLLAMADLSPDLRTEIERLAADRKMPLAPLYAALLSADLAEKGATARSAALIEAADAYADFQAKLLLLSPTDPRVAEVRAAATSDMDLGAVATAFDRYDEAAALDAEAAAASEDVFVARTVSQAETLLLKADAARSRLDHATALAAFAEAEALLARIEPLGLPRTAMKARTGALWDVGDLQVLLGNTGAALAAYQAWQGIAAARSAATPDDAELLRDLEVSHNKIGDVLAASGDLAGAMAAYTAAQALAAVLADRDPQDRKGQSDLAVSHIKLGDIRANQGDAAGAEADFRVALAVMQQLAARDPANADWQRDLAVAQERLGDTLISRGNLAGAEAAYRAALAIHEALAARDPTNLDWQRDLAVGQEKTGDILAARGDLAGAEAAYRAGLVIAERLVAEDPANSLWQRDLSVSHNSIGDLLLQQGDLAGAEAAYRRALVLREALAAQDPANSDWQRDLSVSHSKLGDVLSSLGDLPGAERAHRTALAIAKALAARDPSNTEWQRDLSVSGERLGDVLLSRGDMVGAEAAYRASLAIAETLAARDPANTEWQLDLAISRIKLAFFTPDPRAGLDQALALLLQLQDQGRLPANYVAVIESVRSTLASLPAP